MHIIINFVCVYLYTHTQNLLKKNVGILKTVTYLKISLYIQSNSLNTVFHLSAMVKSLDVVPHCLVGFDKVIWALAQFLLCKKR